MDQKAIRDAFIHNDNQKIQAFYKNVYPMAYRALKDKFPTLDEKDIQDIYQDGVIALWTNIKSGKMEVHEGVKISTYLIQICKYKCMDRFKLKSNQMERADQEFVDRSQLADVVEVEEDSRVNQMMAAVKRLQERCQHLLLLFYFEKKTMDEIAEALSIGKSSVKNEKYRCMQRLKAALN